MSDAREQPPGAATDMEAATRCIEQLTQAVRTAGLPEQILAIIDRFAAATPGWSDENQSRALWRAVQHGTKLFHEDRAKDRANGIQYQFPPPWNGAWKCWKAL